MDDKNLFWKSLSSEYVFDTKWFKVKKEVVKLPTGKVLNDYYVVEGEELIAILAIDSNNNVLLVKQYRHAIGEVTIDLPGGGIEKNEQLIDAAKRELAEETGMIAGHLEKLLTYYPDPGRTACLKHIFFASDLKKDVENLYSQDDSEDISLVSMPLKDVLKGMKSGELKEATLHIGISAYLIRHEFSKDLKSHSDKRGI